MLKLYKWLVYIIMKPYKNFQHLIKCLANYFSIAKPIAEKKNRKKAGGLPLARGKAHLSTRPSPRSPSCLLPPRAQKQLGGGQSAHQSHLDALRLLDLPPSS